MMGFLERKSFFVFSHKTNESQIFHFKLEAKLRVGLVGVGGSICISMSCIAECLGALDCAFGC
jgi:hypothetical protein